jgi:hypothetical protein
MNARRDLVLRAAAAVWGFAIAISLLPIWLGPPTADQLPGYAKMTGFDSRAPLRFVLGLVLIPLLWTLALRPLLTILARDDTRAWARNAFLSAAAAALWFVIISRDLTWVLVVPALVLAFCLAMRRVAADFSRYDLILLPVLATVYLALLDLLPRSVEQVFVLAALSVFAVRSVLPLLRKHGGLAPSLCFALAPLGLALQSSFNAYDIRHSPWAPLVLALLSPFVLRALIGNSLVTRTRIRAALRYVVYPLAAYAYLSAISQFAAEGMVRADLFEDQQHMVPAAEMLRGEKPYRDIIPAHGFVQDALLDYVAFRTGPVTLGRALKFRGLISGTIVMAHYALVATVTGSPEVGLASTFLAMLLGTAGGSFRLLPAIATLALIATAIRRRDARWLAAAGVGVVICILTSLDQGLYLLLTILIAALRFRDDRKRALLFTAIGGCAAAVVSLALMALNGFAGDFILVTLREIATLGPVYTLSAFDAPASLQRISNLPEVLAGIFDKSAYLYIFWPVMLLVVLMTVTSKTPMTSRRRAQREAFLIVGIFGVITAISYAERHHLLWLFVVAPLFSIAIFRLFRSRTPLGHSFAAGLILIALMIAQPTAHLAISGQLRRTHGLLEPGFQQLTLPRGRGAWSKTTDIAIVDTVRRYAESHLEADDTWFDFTNRGNLYFLLNRDCPIRQLEVAFYEPEERQRDVIRRMEQNPRIRFALMPGDPVDTTGVDGVPSRDRAPLVYAYLREHFVFDQEEGDVHIWRRK